MTGPEVHDTLSIFAEVSVAIAGFSGIIIAFGFRSLEALTALEVRRLANLFMLSGFVFIISLLCIALLHNTSLSQDNLWRLASASVFILGTSWLLRDIFKVVQINATAESANNTLVTVFSLLATSGLILQLYNTFYLQTSWPFFIALTLITGGAFQQFILLVHSRIRIRADAQNEEPL